jgi:hypothetical protein
MLSRFISRTLLGVALLLVTLACVRPAQAQTSTAACASTACATVGAQVTISWSAPTTGATPTGYNLISGATQAIINAAAAANVPAPNFVSVGNTLSYIFTATTVGTTLYALNAYNCPASGACTISTLSATVSMTVEPLPLVVQAPPSVNVTVK